MIQRVIGLDGGLARTGVGELTWDGEACTSLTTRLEKSGPTTSAEQTAQRMNKMVRAVAPAGTRTTCPTCSHVATAPPDDVALVVLEGPAYGVKSAYAHDGAGFWWHLRRILIARGLLVAIVNPVHVKTWATGKGRCTDDELKWALDRYWRGVLAGDTDQVDGALLALIGAQYLGWWKGGEPLRQAAELTKMSWPRQLERVAR